MFHIVYLLSCLQCCPPVENLPAGPCVIFMSICGHVLPLSVSVCNSVTISLPPCCFFLLDFFSLPFFLSLWCWKAVAWWWLYNDWSYSSFSLSVCLCLSLSLVILLCGLWGVFGERPLETLSGSITVLRSGHSWFHAEISERYWNFMLPLCKDTCTQTYTQTHPISGKCPYSTARVKVLHINA